MVRRIYAEKKQGFDREAKELLGKIRADLGIETAENIRILFRYDVESARPLPLFETLSDSETEAGTHAELAGARVFATELPEGEPDFVAEAAKVCLRLHTDEEQIGIRTAKIYAVYGRVSEEELAAIKEYVLRPEGRREASLALPFMLKKEYPAPKEIETVFGFRDLDMGGLDALAKAYGFGMGGFELSLLQDYFKSEYRDPTEAELALFDALCKDGRTALSAVIDKVSFEDETLKRAYDDYLSARGELGEEGPVSLNDIAESARKLLEKRAASGNPATGGSSATVMSDGRGGPGGNRAFTLSGEAARPRTAFAALRLACAESPLHADFWANMKRSLDEQEAALRLRAAAVAGQAAAIYHEKYREDAPLFEAFLAAEPVEDRGSEPPAPGDKVILLGSVADPLAGEKLCRLFGKKEAANLVKCMRRVGAEGIALAAASLADGIDLELDGVPAKHAGIGAVGRALSGFGEQTAVVVEPRAAEDFILSANEEGLEAAAVATVTEIHRLILRWRGKIVANLSHELIAESGARRHVSIAPESPADYRKTIPADFSAGMRVLAGDVNIRSGRELCERFDFAIGGKTVFAPLGGKYALTPPQAAVYRISPEGGAAYAAWGGDPAISEKSPYHGAYLSVVESVAKLVAAGADFEDAIVSQRAGFSREKGDVPWGKELPAFLGFFKAQLDLGLFSAGGKTALPSGDIPPSLFSFAAAGGAEREAVSPEFKGAGHKVVLLAPSYGESGLPDPYSLIKNFKIVTALMRADKVLASFAVGRGGVAAGILKCCLGNEVGFRFADMVPMETVFGYNYGAFILELNDETAVGEELGRTTLSETVARRLDLVPLVVLRDIFEGGPSPDRTPSPDTAAENITFFKKSAYTAKIRCEKPHVLLPVFEGMNGAGDAARAFGAAGAEAELFFVKTRTAEEIASSSRQLASRIADAQILFLADGIAGDNVCGSAKFIAEFLRRGDVRGEIEALLEERSGLIGGLGLGFDVLLKLGLLPGGKYSETGVGSPRIARSGDGHSISRIVQVRVTSDCSPWLAGVNVGDIFSVPARIGGGIVCADPALKALAENGQIASQFVDLEGNASMDARYNPGESARAVEGLLSPDGRVFGRMANSALAAEGLYRNVPGKFDTKLFESAVKYFR